MGLDEIKLRVLDGAKAKAEARIAEAGREAEAVRSRGARDAEETEHRLLRKARLDADARKNRLVTDARLAARKAVLAEKQKALDDVFQAAMDTFAASEKDFRVALRRALLSVVETGEESLLLSPADREAWGGPFVEELNRALETAGRKGSIRLSDAGPDIVAGAVLQRGGVEVNLSLEVMARQVREGLEESVAKCLFDADDAREVSG